MMAFDENKPWNEMGPEEFAEAMADLKAKFEQTLVNITATNSVLGENLSRSDRETLSDLWRETEEIEQSVREEQDG